MRLSRHHMQIKVLATKVVTVKWITFRYRFDSSHMLFHILLRVWN
jgi:hypothetical protein